jgi:hypothetical protein
MLVDNTAIELTPYPRKSSSRFGRQDETEMDRRRARYRIALNSAERILNRDIHYANWNFIQIAETALFVASEMASFVSVTCPCIKESRTPICRTTPRSRKEIAPRTTA